MRTCFIAALVAFVPAIALAEPAAIPFREIFSALAEKTTRTGDRTFFETDILRGAATGTHSPTEEPHYWSYTYGPEARRGMASFYDATSAVPTTRFWVLAGSWDEVSDCLTFAQADAELLRQGWSYESEVDRGWRNAEDIGAVYVRNGVALSFVNRAILLAFAHPDEAFKAQQESIEALIDKRLVTTRGTDAYAKLCTKSVEASIARQD